MIFSKSLLLIFSYLFSLSVLAAPLNFCGKIDLQTASNTDIVNILFANDLSYGRSKPRIQCGLPGENLPICSACAVETSEKVMTFLRPLVGAKDHLNWHANWHKIRVQSDLEANELHELRIKGYFPESMSDLQIGAHLFRGESFGEDFFYMHRLMIKMVQLELASAGFDCIAPWKEVPSVNDTIWPVPQVLSGHMSYDKAAESVHVFQAQLNSLRQRTFLSKITLNQLGLKVEPLLHQNLHAFYRSQPECSAEAAAQGFCDDLLPVERSPLNKHFWKIHGLIDNLIGDWLKANQYNEISTDCSSRQNCYQWKSPWVGKYPRQPNN